MSFTLLTARKNTASHWIKGTGSLIKERPDTRDYISHVTGNPPMKSKGNGRLSEGICSNFMVFQDRNIRLQLKPCKSTATFS